MHTEPEAATSEEKSALVHTVSQAVRMLEAFSVQPVQGLNELSRTVGIPRASALRILRTLIAHGIVGRAETKYRLTKRLLELGAAAGTPQAMQLAMENVLDEIVAVTGETTHYAELDGAQVVYIAKKDSPHPIRMNSYVGWRGPVHATAVGKVMLALQSKETVQGLLPAKLERFTPTTIVSTAKLHKELAVIVQQGFAIDDEELIGGLRCVAVSVPHAGGAISVAGPAARMGDDRIVQIVEQIHGCLKNWRP